MKAAISVLGSFLMLLLSACSERGSEPVTGDSGGQASPLMQQQVEALKKARQLEADMDKAYQARDKEIDRMSR